MLAALVAFALLPAAPARADDSTVFTFVGGGWGHSVGMSQYGAYGMSKEGYSAGQIISHFFTGASVGAAGAAYTNPLWVNLSVVVGSATFTVKETGGSPGVPVTVSDGGTSVQVAVGETFTVTNNGLGGCTLSAPAGELSGSCHFDVDWDGWVASPTTLVQLDGCSNGTTCQYARGSLRIRPHSDAWKFNVSLEIAVEDYVLGLAEMPSSWGNSGGMEALKAQAIAARSYALRTAADRGDPASRPICWCQLYATTVDQSYIGWVPGSGHWTTAVQATAGQVVTHPSSGAGVPVKAFYSSSTYGWTESSANGFGGVEQSWLQEVDDHWSANPDLNPFARWSKQFTGAQLAAILNAQGGTQLATVTSISVKTCSDSGAALSLRFHGAGNYRDVATRHLRGWLGLRSMQVLNVGAPPPATFPCPSPIGDLPQGSLPGDLVESVGLHDPSSGIFTLHDPAQGLLNFYYGNPADIPYSGDWNGNGVTTLGLYRQSTGFLFLRNTNDQGVAHIQIYYGNPGDIPIAGDWDGDGVQTVGIYRPSNQRFYLRNTNTQGVADVDFVFGNGGDQPIAGDWNGDERDTIGVYRPSTKMLYLSNTLGGGADIVYHYEGAQFGDRVIVGDWNGDGVDTVGVFRPSTATFYLRDDFTGGADYIFTFGDSSLTPVSGLWS